MQFPRDIRGKPFCCNEISIWGWAFYIREFYWFKYINIFSFRRSFDIISNMAYNIVIYFTCVSKEKCGAQMFLDFVKTLGQLQMDWSCKVFPYT